jgi:hypothetical protein
VRVKEVGEEIGGAASEGSRMWMGVGRHLGVGLGALQFAAGMEREEQEQEEEQEGRTEEVM